jgi:hypothetical protein
MFAAIGTAAFMRESAERRLRHALETLRNNDPAFFDVVMTDHDLALN